MKHYFGVVALACGSGPASAQLRRSLELVDTSPTMSTATPLRPENAVPQTRNRVLVSVALLAIAVVLAYANSFSVPLLFDDWVTIQHNPRLRQLWPIWAAFSPPENSGVGGRPIANLSFVLNYALTGESVRGFHAGNLVIHFLAGLTLFGIIRRTLRLPRWSEATRRSAEGVALAAAALWMLQPVQTQSVTYVSQRTESLMGLFYLLTLYAFIRGAEPGGKRRWFAVAVAACFAGMGTKEGMVTVPVMVLLYDFVFLSGSFINAWRIRWRVYAGLAASWVWLATLMGGLHGRGVGFGLGMSWWSYLLIECRAILRYLSLAIWPSPLVFDYGIDLGTPGVVEVLSALGVIALGIGTLVALWRAPVIGFLGAWFLITLAPTSSVVPIPLQPISENRIYVPTAAVLTGLAVLLHHVGGRRGLRATYVAAFVFGGLTAARNRDYWSELAIWADTVAKRPASSRAHSNLGHALQTTGRLAEAKLEHEAALQIRPDYAEAHVNLASILGQLGQLDAAVAHSRRAAQIDPRNPNAFFNLGVALTQKGDVAGAIAAYESAVRTGIASAETHCNLSLLLAPVGRVQEAIAHAETARRMKPDSVLSRFSLACALALGGRGLEAIPLFQEVIQAQPRHLEAHQNLGTLLLQIGKPAEALVVFESGIRINPNHAGVRFGLGNALLNTGRVADAIREYEATLRLTPPSPDLHLNLGLALAQAGRNAEAAANFETALRLNPQLKAAADGLARLRASGAGSRQP